MAWLKKQLQYKGSLVEYSLKFGDQKNIILKVKEGVIYISAPFHAQEWEINNLIYRNLSKIINVQNTFETIQKYTFSGPVNFVKIFDKKVKINIVEENIHTNAKPDGFYMKNYGDTETQAKKMYNFFR